MKNGNSVKPFAVIAWLVTAAFVLAVALPLLIERVSVTDKSKLLFVNFALTDQDGNRHVGWFCPGFMYFMDVDFAEYGYEAPKGTDVTKWRKTFVDNRDAVKTEDGFVWGDKGFLWASFYEFDKRGRVKEGARLGLDKPLPIQAQTAIQLPGAPWDMRTPTTDLYGKWPNYDIKFSNEFFDIDLKMTTYTKGWQGYNDGKPFSAGDFGRGSMWETTANVTGTITHKKTGKVFNVKGTGLLEDSAGQPWGYASWGAHDWTDLRFEGGWGGSIWKANDNWQWGYNHGPQNGWLYDPELKKAYSFFNVELLETQYEEDAATGARWPISAKWRATAADATLLLQTKSVTWIPGELKIPPSPISMKMSHGLHSGSAQLIRRDGTTVELKGQLIGEHYEPLFPDYLYIGPFMLALLTLSWSAYAGAIRRAQGRSLVAPIAWCVTGLIATALLWYQWANVPMSY